MYHDTEPLAGTSSSHPSVRGMPVVGIGASAGGLEAIAALLSDMTPDSGMALLVVQHLAPNHSSMLSALLADKTAMPVIEATDNELIERDHVYVIPPNTIMTVAQGRLVLRPRDDSTSPPMPIDELFCSLAEQLGPAAIGVLLSGSGSDGARGIRAIKREGGTTFAQDHSSAKFGSMPHAAIETGCVDHVLAPSKMAEELAGLVPLGHLAPRPPQLSFDQVASDEPNLERVFEILNRSCDLDLSHYKRGTLTRRLARRIALLNLSSLADYVSLLESNPDEVHALHQDLLIRVTRFFRDPDVFAMLADVIFPRLAEDHLPNTHLRIWVPGCASGEEVYSIAICLLECLGDRGANTPIQLFGTDVSEAALAQARSGRYPATIATEVSEDRLERFFVKVDGKYQIAKPVRELCVFARHDVGSDPPFSQLHMISCRNLLIYFDPVLQKRVLSLFHYALKPRGVLILGRSETIGSSLDMFHPTYDKKVRMYMKRQVHSRPPLDYGDSNLEPASARRPLDQVRSPEAIDLPAASRSVDVDVDVNRHKRAVDRIVLARYVPAGVLCDENLNVLEFRGDTGPYLTQPPGPPSTNLRRLMRPGVFVAVSDMIAQARAELLPVRRTVLDVDMPEQDDAERIGEVNLEVIPVPREDELGRPSHGFGGQPHGPGRQPQDIGGIWFLVSFGDPTGKTTGVVRHRSDNMWRRIQSLFSSRRRHGEYRGGRSKASGRSESGGRNSRKVKYESAELIQHLKWELEVTRQHMRSRADQHDTSQEELKSTQEELLSSNEEFQSTNEELETAKEELQSSNEALAVTNDELRHSNDDLQRLNAELVRARNYAESIVETAREPLIVLDHELRIMRANAAFYMKFELTPAATEGSLFYELDNGQWDIPALRHLLRDVLPEQRAFQDYELTTPFRGIGMKTLLLNGAHLAWEEQPLILLAIEDVTSYKLAQTALQDADRRKDEFLAMLAHELRGPLAPMRNALEVWRRGDAGKDAEKHAQVIMHRQLRKEARLIDDLLDVARITSGSVVLTRDKVDLRQVVSEALEGTRHQFEEFRHTVECALPDRAIIVEGDSIRLEQVVSNLLTNAAKYTEPGGHVLLTLDCQGERAVLSVKDDGIGIPSQLLPDIFDLFMQVSVSLDRREGGLGIGLTLVRRLVELHGGTVEAKSEGLKCGSEFIVILPLLRDARPTEDEPTCTAPVIPRRVLVVDDSADSAEICAMLLKLEGHTVQMALDGATAIRTAHAFRPEVVFLDIGLPDMSGYEVARALRRQIGTHDALLVAVTGYGQLDDREQFQATGFDLHLTKPVDVERLRAVIADYGAASSSES